MESQVWPSPFPTLRQRINEHPLSFLDSAATTLRPQSVIDALVECIVVQSNVSGRDLRSVVNDIQARVGQNVRLPQGCWPPNARV